MQLTKNWSKEQQEHSQKVLDAYKERMIADGYREVIHKRENGIIYLKRVKV